MRILLALCCTTGCVSSEPVATCDVIATGVTVNGQAMGLSLIADDSTPIADQVFQDLTTGSAPEQDVLVSLTNLAVGAVPLGDADVEYRFYPAGSNAPTIDDFPAAQLSGWISVEAIADQPGDHTIGCYDLTSSTVHVTQTFDVALLGPEPGDSP